MVATLLIAFIIIDLFMARLVCKVLIAMPEIHHGQLRFFPRNLTINDIFRKMLCHHQPICLLLCIILRFTVKTRQSATQYQLTLLLVFKDLLRIKYAYRIVLLTPFISYFF